MSTLVLGKGFVSVDDRYNGRGAADDDDDDDDEATVTGDEEALLSAEERQAYDQAMMGGPEVYVVRDEAGEVIGIYDGKSGRMMTFSEMAMEARPLEATATTPKIADNEEEDEEEDEEDEDDEDEEDGEMVGTAFRLVHEEPMLRGLALYHVGGDDADGNNVTSPIDLDQLSDTDLEEMAYDAMVDHRLCAHCGVEPAVMACIGCEARGYCGETCMKDNWHWHKGECDTKERCGQCGDKAQVLCGNCFDVGYCSQGCADKDFVWHDKCCDPYAKQCPPKKAPCALPRRKKCYTIPFHRAMPPKKTCWRGREASRPYYGKGSHSRSRSRSCSSSGSDGSVHEWMKAKTLKEQDHTLLYYRGRTRHKAVVKGGRSRSAAPSSGSQSVYKKGANKYASGNEEDDKEEEEEEEEDDGYYTMSQPVFVGESAGTRGLMCMVYHPEPLESTAPLDFGMLDVAQRAGPRGAGRARGGGAISGGGARARSRSRPSANARSRAAPRSVPQRARSLSRTAPARASRVTRLPRRTLSRARSLPRSTPLLQRNPLTRPMPRSGPGALGGRVRRRTALPTTFRRLPQQYGRFRSRFGGRRWFRRGLFPWFYRWGLLGSAAYSLLALPWLLQRRVPILPYFNPLADPIEIDRELWLLRRRYNWARRRYGIEIVPDYNSSRYVWVRY